MKDSVQVVRYVRFFFDTGKGIHFFGWQLVSYTLALLVFSLVVIFFGESLARLSDGSRGVVCALLFVLHGVTMASLLSELLSPAHKNYLRYLGFRDRGISLLIRVVAIPANVVFACFTCLVVAGNLSWFATGGLFVALLVLTECLCPVLLRLDASHKVRARQRPSKTQTPLQAVRVFRSPWRAFVAKDMRETKSVEILGIVFVGVVCFLIMLLARFSDSMQVFTLCLYLGMLFPIAECCSLLFSKEGQAYHEHYVPILHLRSKEILMCKMPLQALIIAVMAFCLVAFDGILHGFEAKYLIVALVLVGYFSFFCVALSWIYLRRVQRGKLFDSLYGLSMIPVILIPGIAMIFALVLLVKAPATGGSRAAEIERLHHA